MFTHPQPLLLLSLCDEQARARRRQEKRVPRAVWPALLCLFQSESSPGWEDSGMSNAHWSIATVNIYTTCGRASTSVACTSTSSSPIVQAQMAPALCTMACALARRELPAPTDFHSKCKRVLPPHVLDCGPGGRCRQTNRFSYDHDSTEWNTAQTAWPAALPHLDSWMGLLPRGLPLGTTIWTDIPKALPVG
jgi:hypothetical protein